MARIRSIKPEAFHSESLSQCSVEAERTFWGMSTLADDAGRLRDQPAVINGALWCLRPGHTTAHCEDEIDQLITAGVLCRYKAPDGKQMIHFVTWREHQKISKPTPPRSAPCPTHDTGNTPGTLPECSRSTPGALPEHSSSEVEVEVEVEREPSGGAAPRRAPPPPPDSAQTLIGEHLDACRSRPPDRVVGQTARLTKKLLDEGQPIHAVRAALARLRERSLNPSTLPSLVNEILNPATRGPTPNRHERYDAALDQLAANGQQQPDIIEGQVLP